MCVTKKYSFLPKHIQPSVVATICRKNITKEKCETDSMVLSKTDYIALNMQRFTNISDLYIFFLSITCIIGYVIKISQN